MVLPQFVTNLLKKKDQEAEYFLALEIKKGVTKAAVWKNVSGKTAIVGVDSEECSDDWEDIIKCTDVAIGKTSDDIPDEKIKKTLFALPEYWIGEGKIKSEILNHLKKLCRDLTLSPLGFIVVTEALLSQIQKKEGAPLTSILVGITKKEISVSILRVGKLHSTTILENKGGRVSEQIATVLKGIPEKEILPSRIILYDDEGDLEGAKEDIISFPWTQRASFLHFPKVEILPKNSDIEAIVSVGIKETKNQFLTETVEEPKEETQAASSPMKEKETEKSTTLGFVEEKDILEEIESPVQNETQTVVEPEAQEPTPRIPQPEYEPSESSFSKPEYMPAPPPIEPESNKEEIKLQETIGKIISPFKNLISKRVALIVIATIIIVGLGGTVAAYWSFAKANVKIFIEPQILEQETNILVSSNSSDKSQEDNEIRGYPIEIEETDSIKIPTTGEKIVGEKAKGEVTVYNKTTTGAKTFKAGTILIGPNNLEFTLDQDINIPVATSQLEGITFGKVKANVTASEIGTDSNLPSGKKEFSIKEFPTTSYSAATDTAFTGGSSKKIKVVSEADKEQVTKKVEEKLLEKAKNDLKDKVSSGQKLIEESMEITPGKIKLIPDVGTEAQEVTGQETGKFKAFSYSEKELQEVIQKIVQKSIPSDFEYNNSQTDIQIKGKENLPTGKQENEDGIINLKISFKAKLLPKIDKEELKKALSGKNEDVAKEYAKSIPNIAGFEADVSPRLPKALFRFPRNPNNITIEIIPKT